MPKWGDFQSLIQISIALNAAYFSVAQLGEPFVKAQKRHLSTSLEAANDLKLRNVLSPEKHKLIVRRLISVDDRINTISSADQNVIDVVRIFAILLFFLGLILLGVASFAASEEINVLFGGLCAALSLPVVVAVFFVGVLGSFQYRGISAARRTVDGEMETAQIAATRQALTPVPHQHVGGTDDGCNG